MTSNADSYQLLCLSGERTVALLENGMSVLGLVITKPAGGTGVAGTENESASEIDWEPSYEQRLWTIT